MKKLLLSALLLASYLTTQAQTTVFSENFNATPISMPSGWTLVDSDGDTFNWSVVQITNEGVPAIGYPTPCLRSTSWSEFIGALTPDNWVFTPNINLSNYSGQTITLKWKVSAADEEYDEEKYSVYVSNSNTTSSMLASTTNFTEESLAGINTFTQRTLDISSFAGQSIYVAFRHHGTSDVFSMEIDDIEVTAITTASNEEFFKENFTIFPNPTSGELNISAVNGLELNEVSIFDLTGRKVKSFQNSSTLDVSNLATGTYVIEIKTNEGRGTSKFIKK
ncbi:T9SS C-terminal target domain-containing protein [Paenimyroides tangerinum]|uniref:T9SS C-terminal target domain-containing protein n=1 Tax=Paenimyroides tangerinum TaxID=2488728 RepID=A0A3P3WBX6_9FLAO|nr:choice-of-anchor J domain-containing protein [Paenimyroides tangerinum]RRJ91827.1 T9SS C-terminal target domain-containing protein [Paenimyroides tangerinum]